MRAFFALDIDPAMQHAIADWRDCAMPPVGRAVPPANFHITLHFLGNITAEQFPRLCAEAERIAAPKMALHLNESGYFPKPSVFWIAPAEIPADLLALAATIRKASRRAGLRTPTPRKSYQPHLTLFRNCRARPPLPTRNPDFDLTCDGFALFRSVFGRKGVRYEVVRRWTAE